MKKRITELSILPRLPAKVLPLKFVVSFLLVPGLLAYGGVHAGAVAESVPKPAQATSTKLSGDQFDSVRDYVTLRVRKGRKLLFTDTVKINGKRMGYFLIDTGANLTVLDTKRIKQLGLKPYRDFMINGQAAGKTYIADTFVLGPLVVRRHMVGTADLQALQQFDEPVVGVLGNDVFGKVPFTVDYTAPALILHNPRRFKPPRDVPAYKLMLIEPLRGLGRFSRNEAAVIPAVDVVINGQKRVFILDTGFNRGLFVSRTDAARQPKMIGRAIHPIRHYTSVVSQDSPQRRFRVDELLLLGRKWRHVSDTFTPTPESSAGPAGQTHKTSAVGSSLLRKYRRLTFDFGRSKIWAEKTASRQPIPNRSNVDKKDFAGLPPVVNAALDGDTDRFKELLKAGASTTFSDKEGYNLLHMSVIGGSADVLALLLRWKDHPDLDQSTKDGGTPLMFAAVLREPRMAAALINAGADLDRQTRLGDTALTYAVTAESPEIVKLLLKKGADINLSLRDGRTPAAVAAARGSDRMFNILVKAGASLDLLKSPDGRNILHFAAYGGSSAVIRQILKLMPHIQVDKATRKGITPLMIAAEQGHTKAVEAFIGAGANPRALTATNSNVGGKTAIHFAAMRGHEHVVKALLDHGIAVDAKTTSGLTPLMLAAGKGYLRVVNVLLENGADVNATDHEQMTALHYAAKFQRPSVIPRLLRAGAKGNAVARKGVRPLDFAAIQGDVDTARLLVEGGADPEAKGSHGFSAVDFARKRGHAHLADLLARGFRFAPKSSTQRR